MNLVDTKVNSEPWKPEPELRVLDWFDAQAIETLYLSAITVAELRFGIAALPTGRRRQVLHDRLEVDVLPLFEGRVLAFDLAASAAYAELMARAKAAGKAIGIADGYIAGTVAWHGFLVATRDTGPSKAAGLTTLTSSLP